VKQDDNQPDKSWERRKEQRKLVRTKIVAYIILIHLDSSSQLLNRPLLVSIDLLSSETLVISTR